jgi:hypothetical protein
MINLRNIKILAVLAIMVILTACSDTTPTSVDEVDGPFISIIALEKLEEEPGKQARLFLKVKNTGNEYAFDVKWSTKFLNGSKNLGSITGNIGELAVGESAEREIPLTTVERHEDYSNVVVNLTWENSLKFEYARTYSE